MSNEERKELITLLQESEAELLATIEEVSEFTFINRMAKNTWTIAEIVEHIIIADTGLLRSIQKKGQDIRDTIPEVKPNGWIVKATSNRKVKVTAPHYLLPKGLFTSKEMAIQAFRKNRATVEDFINTTELPLEKIAFKHFALGLLNGKGWIAFMAGHCRRHTMQIKEIIAL